MTLLCVIFFFQAEDGIRDVAVTGVQTCALPILISCPWISRSSMRYRAMLMRRACGSRGSPPRLRVAPRRQAGDQDRKSVVEGKSVGLGGRRIIKKKKKKTRRTRPVAT